MTDLHGKRVLITGGAGGVGSAVAQRVAAAGARVLLADRDELELGRAVANLASSCHVEAVTADLSSPSGLKRMFDRVDAWLGGLDILVACAGVG
jgi:3-hydroxy acid dehydrogenase/malonic semialdehyde reductase